MKIWKEEEIDTILRSFEMKSGLSSYRFSEKDNRLVLLGKGASARVYEGYSLDISRDIRYAVKVIGFNGIVQEYDAFMETVRAQQTLSDLGVNGVVKIYYACDLYIELDDKGKTSAMIMLNNDTQYEEMKNKHKDVASESLRLQFIVMEKCTPVIGHREAGDITITPNKLMHDDERELLKLAYDIGDALQNAHARGILHGDIKLENIFYSEAHDRYKLGDFGAAKETDNGYAGSDAYTNGYAAPEIVSHTMPYSYEADIYSLGMTLYILLNDICFPNSESYDVNSHAQYQLGYELPRPATGYSYIYDMTVKMCRYDKKERYHSMKDVMHDIEKELYGELISYKNRHNESSYVAAMAAWTVGMILYLSIYMPYNTGNISLLMYATAAAGFLKLTDKRLHLNDKACSVVLAVIGGAYIITEGVTLLKVAILIVSVMYGRVAGIVSVTSLAYIIASWCTENNVIEVANKDYQWIMYTAVSVAIIMLIQFIAYDIDNYDLRGSNKKAIRKTSELYISILRVYWNVITVAYGIFTLLMLVLNNKAGIIYIAASHILGTGLLDWFVEPDMYKAGLAGMLFCIIWNMRERILIAIDNMENYHKYY